MKFDEAFDRLIAHEGGYSFHPSDPGGETMWGVTARVARANGYRDDMRSMPKATAMTIYRKLYWDAVRADELPEAVRFDVFDAAVNSGTKQAAIWLQRAVNAVEDGRIGPMTIGAAQAGGAAVAARFNGHRLDMLTSLPTWGAFGKGWARRIAANLQAMS